MSSAEPPAVVPVTASPGLLAIIHDSVRKTVAVASTSKWIVPVAAVAAVAAAACAPVAWPLLAGGAVAGSAALTAAFGQVGGLGGGLLSEAVIRAWDRLRKDPGAGENKFQEALAAELTEALTSSSQSAAELRAEVAGVLHSVDAVKVALTETVTESSDQLRAVLIRGLCDFSTQFTEFGWLLWEVNDQVAALAETQAELTASSRAILTTQQQTLMHLIMLRQQTRPAGGVPAPAAGVSADEERAAALNAVDVPVALECPYPGLSAFGPQDVDRFFGREELTATLLSRLAQQLAGPGLLMVLGPSGSGKSSLLRAGLLPAIAAGRLPARGSEAWPVELMTPTQLPLLELAVHVAGLSGVSFGTLEADLHADPGRMVGAIRQGLLAHARHQEDAQGPGSAAGVSQESRLILVIDQFEEVFTQCADEQERRAFIQALCVAAGVHSRGGLAPALVVIGIRADFFARTVAYLELVPYLQDCVLVGPMNEAGLRAAIEGPAAPAGLVVDAGLVEVLLTDLGAGGHRDYEAGRLPLLAYALQQTWEHREGRRLTVAAYRLTGGIDKAVAHAADAVYGGLDADGKDRARRLLLRLVNLGEGTADTRRRVTVTELAATRDTVTRSVLTELIQARLLTADTGSDGQETVEITHEALLSAWPELRAWLDEDRTGQETHRDLTEAAHAWRSSGSKSSYLFAGTRLAMARKWAAGHERDLNLDEQAFLAASQQHERRASLLRRTAVAALAVLVLVAVSAAAMAIKQNRHAQSESNQAIINEVTAEAGQLQSTDPSLAAQLDLVVRRLSPASDSDNTSVLLGTANIPLSNPLTGHTGPVYSVAFSPNGRTLATASQDGTIRLWNVSNVASPVPIGQPLNGHGGSVNSVAFSPNGRTLAASDGDGTVQLWNVSDPSAATLIGQPLAGFSATSLGVAFSPDGNLLAVGSQDGTVRLWDVADPSAAAPAGPPLNGHDGVIWSVAFSPDSKTLAVGDGDDTIQLWNVASPARATAFGQPLTGFNGPVYSVAFSPDGDDLAAGSGDRTARLWNVANPARATALGSPLTGADNTVASVAFSPNGDSLAVGSQDDKIRLWNVTDPTDASLIGQPLIGHRGPVYSVAFSPDGSTLASGSGDETARLWNLPSTVLTGQTGTIDTVAFSPDGRVLATGSYDGTVRLWSLVDPARPVMLAVPLYDTAGWVTSVAFSPDGDTLAVASYGATVELWNVANPAHATPIGQLTTGTGNPVRSVAFSPHGNTLAAGNGNGTVQPWDVANPADPTPIGAPLPGPGEPVYPWHSAPVGTRWPLATTTTRSSCGTSPTCPTPLR